MLTSNFAPFLFVYFHIYLHIVYHKIEPADEKISKKFYRQQTYQDLSAECPPNGKIAYDYS